MNVNWKPIAGYEEFYLIGDNGVVKTLHKNNKNVQYLSPRVKEGYLCVDLCRNATGNYTPLHRIIATAFIENPKNKPLVNHINGIKLDNRIGNLEWATHQENTLHAFNMGLTKYELRKGPKILKSKQLGYIRPSCKSVDKLSLDGAFIQAYPSILSAATDNGVASCTIHNFLTGKCSPKKKMVAGFRWRYSVGANT